MCEIQIGTRAVGPAHAALVIAEIGINHEGSLATAREMVDAAARAGVEVIKRQTHIVDDEMSAGRSASSQETPDVSLSDIVARCALSEPGEYALRQYIESKGVIFISTPFSRAAADGCRA